MAVFTAAVSGGKPPYFFTVESATGDLTLTNKLAAQGGTISYSYSNAPAGALSFVLVVTTFSAPVSD